jgi:hemerythrin-like domain-containing protein
MNAIDLLREMHADTKVKLRVILGVDDPAEANTEWQALQPLLTLHEQLEDEHLYGPLHAQLPPGTRLGDWELIHDRDVAVVKQLVQHVNELQPGTPAWQMGIGQIVNALTKHVTEEEGQIFPRIEQVWNPQQLEAAGQQMQKLVTAKTPASAAKAEPARRKR